MVDTGIQLFHSAFVGVFIDAILCAILVAKDGAILIGVNEGEYLGEIKAVCVGASDCN